MKEIYLKKKKILQEENFFRDNIRSALEQFRYISDGNEAVVHPHFTYYGFRYMRLTKWEGPVSIDNFVGCNFYSNLDMAGHLETGLPLVNRLILNGLWSQRDNFLDVPTDCPQRDERLGWTGDAQIFCETAMFNMDCYAFYRKYMREVYLTQCRDEGIPPILCPIFHTRETVPNFPSDGMIAWSDAATIMPWNIYLMNGKRQILEDYFDGMKMWVEVMLKHMKDGLWDITYLQLCDWLALDGTQIPKNKDRIFGGTELTYTCTVFYYWSLTLHTRLRKFSERMTSTNFTRSELKKHSKQSATSISHQVDVARSKHRQLSHSLLCSICTQKGH